jgi:hypothetical protein
MIDASGFCRDPLFVWVVRQRQAELAVYARFVCRVRF